jgi:ABC-type transporter Mla maintaining outer membrane lipid asymmetry permease subunit MlaE
MLLLFKMFVGAIAGLLAFFSLFEIGVRYLQGTVMLWGTLRPIAQLLLFSYLAWYFSPKQVRKRYE